MNRKDAFDGRTMGSDQELGAWQGDRLRGDGPRQPSFRRRRFMDARTGSPWRDLMLGFGAWNSDVRFSALGQEGRLGESFQGVGGRSRLRIPDHRLDHRAGAPACGRRKRGTQNQAIGRSRGGLTSKVHIAVDALGNPLRFILTPGQRHDIKGRELDWRAYRVNICWPTRPMIRMSSGIISKTSAWKRSFRRTDPGPSSSPMTRTSTRKDTSSNASSTKSNTSDASRHVTRKRTRPTWPCSFS